MHQPRQAGAGKLLVHVKRNFTPIVIIRQKLRFDQVLYNVSMLFIHFKTLFSFKFYQRLIALAPRYAWGFALYLFAVSVIVCVFFTNSVLKNNLPAFLKNFPQVTFEKGVLTAPDVPVEAPIPGTDFRITFDASAQVPPSAAELIKNNTLAWVHKNQIYIVSGERLQMQTLPENLSFTSSQENLKKYKGTLAAALRITAFFTSMFVLGFVFLMNWGLALCVCLFFNVFHHSPLSKGMLCKLAAFLLGPLMTLWCVRLWVNIPLFSLAQFIVCVIYVQQIYNSLRTGRVA